MVDALYVPILVRLFHTVCKIGDNLHETEAKKK